MEKDLEEAGRTKVKLSGEDTYFRSQDDQPKAIQAGNSLPATQFAGNSLPGMHLLNLS